MKLLLDTHAFLWLVSGDARLSHKAQEAFLDRDNEVFLSAASFWEIGVKVSLGRLELAPNWAQALGAEMNASAVGWLPVEMAHCVAVSQLPFHHRDPFDRMLVVQARSDGLALVSRDEHFRSYGVDVVW